MEILKDFKNDLLNRRELKVVVEAEKNPGFSEAVRFIASKFNASKENVAVNQVKGKFGRRTFLIDASIYDSAEDKKRVEPKSKKAEAKEEAGADKREQEKQA